MQYITIFRYIDTIIGCIDIILWLSVLRYIDILVYCPSSSAYCLATLLLSSAIAITSMCIIVKPRTPISIGRAMCAFSFWCCGCVIATIMVCHYSSNICILNFSSYKSFYNSISQNDWLELYTAGITTAQVCSSIVEIWAKVHASPSAIIIIIRIYRFVSQSWLYTN